MCDNYIILSSKWLLLIILFIIALLGRELSPDCVEYDESVISFPSGNGWGDYSCIQILFLISHDKVKPPPTFDPQNSVAKKRTA
jgi:hypothetical protein